MKNREKKISLFEESKQNFLKYVNFALWALLFVNVFSMAFYQFNGLKSDFYHEAAFPHLYALSDIENGTLFNTDFSGREIAPIGWPLIIRLLFSLGFELNFVTVAISNLIFLGFCLFVLIWFARTYLLNRTQTLLVLTLFTIPFGSRPFRYSWFDQVWIWPLNSYGIYEIFSLILCIFVYKMLLGSSGKETFLSFLRHNTKYLAAFFVFGLNHNRGFFEIYGPVFFSLVLLHIYDLKSESLRKRSIRMIISSTLFFTILGRFLIALHTKGVPQYWQEASQSFTNLEITNFVDKLFSPIFSIFGVFGVNPAVGQPVVSVEGIRVFSLLLLVIILIFVPLAQVLNLSRFNQLDLGAKLMSGHFLYFVIVSFLTSVFTSTAGVIRYSIPLAISAIFLSPFIFQTRRRGFKTSLVLVISLMVPSVAVGSERLVGHSVVNYKETSNYKLTTSLLDRNLNYGYAGPWTEDVLTIPFYSQGKIHISLIDVNPIKPHLHADKSWFTKTDHVGPFFVAVPTALLPVDDTVLMLKNEAVSLFEVDKWTVFVFQENPYKLIGQLP